MSIVHATTYKPPQTLGFAGAVWRHRRGLLRRAATAIAMLAVILASLPVGRAGAQATPIPGAPAAPVESGYAPVNGLQMYYEIHGEGGVPLVLLHGSFATITMWGPLLPALAESRQVIAVELQGHGRTADVDRPFSTEQFAGDVAALLEHLAIEQADVAGYSLGGWVALEVAIRHPELVRKLVVVSAPFNREGVHPEVFAGIETLTPELFEGTPPQTEYVRLAPDPDGFPALVARIQQLERDFGGATAEEVQGITAPTLLIFGDADIGRPEHVAEMFVLLGGGIPGDFGAMPVDQLAVLPGANHIGVVMRPELLVEIIAPFLDAPMPEAA